eukprot:577926-Pelagomonas_calceolata.AAC.2
MKGNLVHIVSMIELPGTCMKHAGKGQVAGTSIKHAGKGTLQAWDLSSFLVEWCALQGKELKEVSGLQLHMQASTPRALQAQYLISLLPISVYGRHLSCQTSKSPALWPKAALLLQAARFS